MHPLAFEQAFGTAHVKRAVGQKHLGLTDGSNRRMTTASSAVFDTEGVLSIAARQCSFLELVLRFRGLLGAKYLRLL